MSVKVLDKYKGSSYGTSVEVVGLSEVLGERYVAFQQASNGKVFWHSEKQFLADYTLVPKYERGDILEFINGDQRVRVLYLGGEKAIRLTPWEGTSTPSVGRLDYYNIIDPNPRVLRNFDIFIASAYKENKS